MNTEITRRAVLAGAPAMALVATIPGSLKAAPSAAWQKVKADYAAACQRFDAAQDAYTRADSEQMDFRKTAPEREVTYTEDGWRIANDEIHIEAQPSERVFVLTRHSLASAPEGMKATPEYAAFATEVQAWQERREAHAEARGWNAVEQEWEDALDAQTAAWRALVACPVHTIHEVAEKLALSRKVSIEEDEAAGLMDAVSADLNRITAH